MKKLLGIVVLSLLLSVNVFANHFSYKVPEVKVKEFDRWMGKLKRKDGKWFFKSPKKFKKLDIDNKILDPYRYLDAYPNIKVDYLYGKYDTEYVGFADYVKQFKFDNLNIQEIDYKISDFQTHNIRPYIDRKILPNYINDLT